MRLYDELISGTRKFTIHEDGTKTITDLPPTSRELRVAEVLKTLYQQLEGLGRCYNTARKELDALQELFNKYSAEYQALEKQVLEQTFLEKN